MGEVVLKDMTLVFNVFSDEGKLERRVEDLNGNLIYTTGILFAADYDLTEAGLDDYEGQMRQLECWNIAEHVRNYL